MPELKDIIELIENIAPLNLAESWDNSGLQIGNPHQQISKVGIALDPDLAILEKCVASGVDLLITHHPLFFSKLKSLNFTEFHGKFVETAIKNNISLYSAHTSLDSADGGLNDYIFKKLEIDSVETILPSASGKPMEGLGRIGRLQKEMSLIELGQMVKSLLSLDHVRVIGDENQKSDAIGCCTGSGASLIKDAFLKKASFFITGDMKYHEAKDALELGMGVIDAGHHGTEIIACELLKSRLAPLFEEKGFNVDVLEFLSEDVFKII